MDIEKEVKEYSKSLAIPTDKLQTDTYHDPTHSKDITQVFFRERSPSNQKWAFQVVNDGPNSIVKDQLHKSMERMNDEYLGHSNKVTYYRGQSFIQRVTGGGSNESQLEIVCTDCGYVLSSPEFSVERMREKRDILLMWMLGTLSRKSRCDCHNSNTSTSDK